jgi:DNA helicase-2/ATP-dependent DNA helicase PcrA
MKNSDSPQESVSLSADQQSAIDTAARAVVVLAGAGSGKTEVVARRVQRLLGSGEGVGRILALTYTNKAAEELRDRLRDRAGAETERVTTETIHGFAHLLLRQNSTRIGLPVEPELLTRDEDRVELLDQWRRSEGRNPERDPLGFLREIDLDRARDKVTTDVQEWRRALTSLPGLDYPGLLDAAFDVLALRSVRRQIAKTYTHVVVDEAQNLTPAQYRLLTSILGDDGSGPAAMLVGDDKQSIISFAGADPELMMRFARDYNAEVIELTQDFRSAKRISELAQVIAADLGQRSSHSGTHAAQGKVSLLSGVDELDEARKVGDWIEALVAAGLPSKAVAPGESTKMRDDEIAVLGRSASALRAVANELESRGVRYSTSIDSGDWLEGLLGKVVLEVIALNADDNHVSPQWQLGRLIGRDPETLKTREQVAAALNGHPNVLIQAAERLLNSRDLGHLVGQLRTLEIEQAESDADLASWQADVEEIEKAWTEYNMTVDRDNPGWSDFRVFCSRRQRGSTSQGVQLITIHKSQGREFKAVAVVGMNEGQIPDFRAKTKEEHASELRTFYVAVTRARRVLLLSRAQHRMTRFGSRQTTPSPYLRFAGFED